MSCVVSLSEWCVSNQHQMIDEAEQLPFVIDVSICIRLLIQVSIQLLDQRRIIHAFLVLKLLLQLFIGLFDPVERVIETNVHIDVLH